MEHDSARSVDPVDAWIDRLHVSAATGRLDEARWRYGVGRTLDQAHADLSGVDGAVRRLYDRAADELGLGGHETLYTYVRVARAFPSWGEVESLLSCPSGPAGEGGRGTGRPVLGWTHLRTLARVDSPSDRLRLAESAALRGLSSRALERLVVGESGGRGVGGGAAPAPPRDLADAIERTRLSAVKSARFAEAFVGSGFDVGRAVREACRAGPMTQAALSRLRQSAVAIREAVDKQQGLLQIFEAGLAVAESANRSPFPPRDAANDVPDPAPGPERPSVPGDPGRTADGPVAEMA